MQERIEHPSHQGWQVISTLNVVHDLKYYLLMFTVLLTMVGIFIMTLLSDTETNLWFIKEGGLVESLSAAGYFLCVLAMTKLGSDPYLKRMWYFPVVLLAFGMRELDFDKKFTEVGVLKSKFLFSPDDSITVKIIGTSIVLFILFAAWKIIRQHGPGLVNRMRVGLLTSTDWCSAIAISFLVISKSIDGFGRKLSGLGIEVSSQIDTIAAHLEESMEWAIPYLFIVAVFAWFSNQCVLPGNESRGSTHF